MRFLIINLLLLLKLSSFSYSDNDTLTLYKLKYSYDYRKIEDTIFFKLGLKDYLIEFDSNFCILSNKRLVSPMCNILLVPNISKYFYDITKDTIKNRNIIIEEDYFTSLRYYMWLDGIVFDNILYSLFAKNKVIIIKKNKSYHFKDVRIAEEDYNINPDYCGEDLYIYDKNELITTIDKTRNSNFYKVR